MNPTGPGIYMIRNTLDNKVYVDQSTNMWKRWRHHRSDLRNGNHPNSHLQRAWSKYGEDVFVFSVVEHVTDLSVLSNREGYFCDLHRAQDPDCGYNQSGVDTDAGHVMASSELRQKRSVNRIGKKDTDETRRRKSVGRSGIPMSDVTKEKLRVAHLGMVASEATKQKMSDARKGRKASPEVVEKAKIHAAAIGLTFPVWAQGMGADSRRGKTGTPHTEEEKQKIGAAHRGKVLSEETKRKISESRKAMFASRQNSQSHQVED